MYVTPDRAKRITGYELTLQDISIAQSIIETYTGRMEATVDDADDLELMAKATSYQAAYLKNDSNRVFEQAAVDSIVQDASAINFKPGDYTSPFVAPLAVMALRQLTWKKSRSIKIGRMEMHRTRRTNFKEG